MPRVTYADRFIALLARPLNKRDRQFCESLQSFYLRKGRLTAGRVRCVKQLEERYSAEKMAEAAERGGAGSRCHSGAAGCVCSPQPDTRPGGRLRDRGDR